MKCELGHNDSKRNLPGLVYPIEICPFSNKIIISSIDAKLIVGKEYWKENGYEICDKDLEECVKNHPERLPLIKKELERLNKTNQESIDSRDNFLKGQGFYQRGSNYDKPKINDDWVEQILEYSGL